MRVAIFAVLLTASLVMVFANRIYQRPVATAQEVGPVRRAVENDSMIVHSATASDGSQLLTVIEPGRRVMAVYHVDRVTGKISLRSARNIQWDLQMDDFNGAEPKPREIRSLLLRSE